jgi:hypothetical protein
MRINFLPYENILQTVCKHYLHTYENLHRQCEKMTYANFSKLYAQ